MQLNFFSKPLPRQFEIHSRETTPECEEFLNENKEHLSNNCRILFETFMRGEHLTSFNSPVGDFRRRVGELWKDNGVKIHNQKIKTEKVTIKEWWMTDEDKKYNQIKFKHFSLQS